jgi:hypothetical protein
MMMSGVEVDVRARVYFRWSEALLRMSNMMVHAGGADSGST